MRRTKIVATLGPASSRPECLAQLIDAGMDVARLNFSHGVYADHAANIAAVRAAAAAAGRPITVLQDLQGPKIRTGALAHGQAVDLRDGQPFTITNRDVTGAAECVSTTYAPLPAEVNPGDRVLLSDGLIELRVVSASATDVLCEVVHGGSLREHQGINLPGVRLSAAAVTDKDIEDLRFGLEQDVDMVAISFVRRAADVQQVKDLIRQAGKDTPVIAKIERPEAVEVLPDILAVADGVMVARGDLGVEMPPEQVPLAQKQIITAANRCAVPVITATQMLESMIHNPRPTRAEVSDVANAILDGSDAVMLSGETSIGEYPVETVRMMARIAEAVEGRGRSSDVAGALPWALPEEHSTAFSIAAAVSAIVQTLPVKAVCVFTQSGSTARLVASYRPGVPILAFTPFERVYRRLALLWGVIPQRLDYVLHLREFQQEVERALLAHGYAQPGDLIVITGGHPLERHGPTNFLKIQCVGECA